MLGLSALIVFTPLLQAIELERYHQTGDLPPNQDPELRAALEFMLCSMDYCNLVNEDLLAVAVVLLDEDKAHRLAMVNGHHMMYAASLPKLAIALGALVAAERGQLILNDDLLEELNAMIRVSCNECATEVLAKVGRENLLSILQEPQFAFYDAQRSGGIWVGKDYAADDAYRRDPIGGFSHAATVYQVARMYYRLNAGSLLDEHHAAIMRDILGRPGIDHKFVAGLAGQEGLSMLRKSGSWKNYHADSAMIQQNGLTYIVVALVNDDNGEQILRRIAAGTHKLMQSKTTSLRVVP
ncbi:MAG: serine hydrolase [Halioglobus sp.]